MYRTKHIAYFFPNVETNDYNVMIEGRNFSDQLVKNCLRAYDNIQKITTAHGDDYATALLLDFLYFKKYYKMIAIDLNK